MLRQEEPIRYYIHLYLPIHRHRMPSVPWRHCTPLHWDTSLASPWRNVLLGPLLFSHYIFYLDVLNKFFISI